MPDIDHEKRLELVLLGVHVLRAVVSDIQAEDGFNAAINVNTLSICDMIEALANGDGARAQQIVSDMPLRVKLALSGIQHKAP